MDEKFEDIISTYISNKIGVSSHFISEELAAQLRQNVNYLFQENALQEAGIGRTSSFAKNKAIRSDVIFWLDEKNKNPIELAFFKRVEEFINYLNKECYAGINNYEFHYALYKPGTFYKRHLDQFQDSQNRQFSMITYLNLDWKTGDGGELIIYKNEEIISVSPTNCKTVFFKSNELEHEVLETHQYRLSITGWLRKD